MSVRRQFEPFHHLISLEYTFNLFSTKKSRFIINIFYWRIEVKSGKFIRPQREEDEAKLAQVREKINFLPPSLGQKNYFQDNFVCQGKVEIEKKKSI